MKKSNQIFRTITPASAAAAKFDTINFHNSNVDSLVALIDNRNPLSHLDGEFHTSSPSSVSKTVDDLWRQLKEESVEDLILNPLSCLKDFDRVYVEDQENVGFGNKVDIRARGKRRRVAMEPMDDAALQRQRRMIKNRESAARSRERKQAHQIELESIASRLEEENERLLKEKAERSKERLKQLWRNRGCHKSYAGVAPSSGSLSIISCDTRSQYPSQNQGPDVI
ncbi:G-box-binding factor 4-like isoform X2 [Cucumis melo]|uniref:G-box-binding factor 4-like isoform X2 n=1 Tax=Cucumis melo TaxID=3656 RepID=A0A1S3CGA7_CUCME|nr:G-box-binding factor 4-like isoform X2 [Cucumis melo]